MEELAVAAGVMAEDKGNRWEGIGLGIFMGLCWGFGLTLAIIL